MYLFRDNTYLLKVFLFVLFEYEYVNKKICIGSESRSEILMIVVVIIGCISLKFWRLN